MRFIPAEMNTSDSWAVNTPSATCQQWLMSNARSRSPSSVLSVPQTHTNCNTCKPLTYSTCTRPHTHVHTPSHTQTAGASLSWLGALRGTQRKMDRQELSVRTQGHGVGFSLQIMNHMWSVNSAPIRSDDNYLSTSHSSYSGCELLVGLERMLNKVRGSDCLFESTVSFLYKEIFY